MTDYADLAHKLRTEWAAHPACRYAADAIEAQAAEIAALRARVGELEGALRMVVELVDAYEAGKRGDDLPHEYFKWTTAARNTLEKPHG